MTPRRIAISGGPGTGKTTLIQELENSGYTCFHEFSRHIIKESLAIGSDVLPWKDLPAFSARVVDGRVNQHTLAVENKVYFYDRTLVDTLAYQYVDDLPVEDEWLRMVEQHRYETNVFITPPWEDIFGNDSERMESYDKLLRIHDVLCATYEKFGYNVIEVPRLPVLERKDWLIQQI